MAIGFLEGLLVTLKTAGRKPVTAEYPEPDKRLEVQERFMGFPALTWDSEIGEPYCTGCMVCIRNCPTQCMSAQMKDNPLQVEGKSRRRKIIDEFEINLGRCILCAICVDVCNFDAIEMSHEHELSKYERNGNRVDLQQLLEMGKEYQEETSWTPKQPEKNSGVPLERPAPAGGETAEAPAATTEAAPASEMTKEERLAAARARAAAKRQATETGETPADTTAQPKSEMSAEDRVAAARARAAAKRQSAETGETPADSAAQPKSEMSAEERVAAARARAAAKRQATQDAVQTDEQPVDEGLESKPRSEMTPEERVAAARARAAARRQATESQNATEKETDSDA